MPNTSRAAQLQQLNPVAFKEVSSLYAVLARHIDARHHHGPALTSLEAFCDLYLDILPDAKHWARIMIASAHGGEVWLGFYHPHLEELGVEFIERKERPPYGTQVSRWSIAGPSLLATYDTQKLKGLFSGYST